MDWTGKSYTEREQMEEGYMKISFVLFSLLSIHHQVSILSVASLTGLSTSIPVFLQLITSLQRTFLNLKNLCKTHV